jgi:hypothetical protein
LTRAFRFELTVLLGTVRVVHGVAPAGFTGMAVTTGMPSPRVGSAWRCSVTGVRIAS